MSVARRTYALALRDLFQPELLAAGAEATIKHGAEAAIKHGTDIGSNILKDVAGKFVGDTIKNMVKKAQKHFTDNSQKWDKVFQQAHEHAFKTLEIALAGPSFWESTWLGQLKTSATNQALVDAMRGFFAEAFAAADDSFLQNCQRELRIARHQDFFKDLRGFKINELAHENNPLVQFDDPAALIDAELNLIDQIANDFRTNNYPNLARLLSFKPPEGQHMLAVAVQFHFKSAVLADEKLRNEFQLIKMERLGADLSSGFQFLAGLMVSQAQELESVLDGLSRVEIKVDQTHAVTVATHEEVVWLRSAVCELNANLRMANRPVTPLDQLNMPATETPKIDDHIRKLDQLPPPVRRQQSNLSLAISREAWVAGRFEQSRRIARELAATSKSPLKKAEGYHLAYRCSLELQDFPAALDDLMEAIRHDPGRKLFDIAKYEPEAIIGSGAFAVAFRCKNQYTDETVVIKTFDPGGLELPPKEIFREARLLKTLRNPNIIELIDCDFYHSKPFLVLEYIENSQDLDRFLKQTRQLTTTELLQIALPIAQGMKAAHGKGVLHRDIKPANLLVREENGQWLVKIIDFGLAMRQERLARSQHQQISARKSLVGSSVAGTPDYAAPEQLDMERIKEIGPHSDVYAFGKLCYFALFNTTSPNERRHLRTLSEAWRDFLSECVDEEIEHRLPHFDAVLARLNQIASPQARVVVEPVINPNIEILSPAAPHAPKNEEPKLTPPPKVDVPKPLPKKEEPKPTPQLNKEPQVAPQSPDQTQVKTQEQVTTKPEPKAVEPKKKGILSSLFGSGGFVEKENGRAEKLTTSDSTVGTNQPISGRLTAGTKAGDRHVITFNKIEIPFRWCPPGKFKMGSPESEEDRFDNENQVDVTLTKGFWMMETEVTQELYQAVIGQNPSHFKGSRKLPVDKVSWYDAQTFIQKLNETNAVVNQLSGFRFTLPTEAQWEYACRAGTTTATAFGDSLSSEQANFDGNYPYNGAAKGLYLGKTIPVSSYPPNSWGLYDMHGNVYEWVSDWYVKTLTGGADLSGPAETSYRVLRGGSWHFIGRLCRSAYRFGSNPANRHKFNGFRFAIIWF